MKEEEEKGKCEQTSNEKQIKKNSQLRQRILNNRKKELLIEINKNIFLY